MKRPILQTIIDEINALFERMPKGPGIFDERSYLEQRIAIIRAYGYTEKTFKRAMRAEERDSNAKHLPTI